MKARDYNRTAKSDKMRGFEKGFQKKPFYESAKLMHTMATVFGYVAAILSMLGALYYVSGLLKNVFPAAVPAEVALAFAVLIGSVMLFGVETVKRHATTTVARIKMRDRKIQVGALAALIAMSAISVTSTILGAKQFAAESNSGEALASVNDSLRADYANTWNVPITSQRDQIQGIEKRVDELIANKQLYSMPKADRETVASKQATISQLISERDAALVIWDAKNEKVLSSVQGKDTELVRFFVIFSALVEVMAVGCVWFCMYYEFRVIVESGKLAKIRRGARIGETDEHGNSRKVLVPTNGSSAAVPVNGKSIGFGNKTDENGNPTAEYTIARMCDNCNSTFKPKRYDHRFCGSKCRGNYHAKFRVR